MAATPWRVDSMLNNHHVRTICKEVLEDLLTKVISGQEVKISEPEVEGQLISKCPFAVTKSTKKPMKIL
jgi:hypothetical protein